MSLKILTRIVQIIIVAVPIVIFGWLVNNELVPSGVFIERHAVNELSPFIDRILPDSRVLAPRRDENGEWVQSIIADPTYFFVHPHRHFDRVDVELWFKNEEVPIVELGALARKDGQIYDLRPVQNLLIDESPWHRVEENGLILLQREKKFDSVQEFLNNLPPRYEIATYHHKLDEPYRIAGYRAKSDPTTIDVSLRGFHEFYTYIKDETLHFEIKYMDMNRKADADPVSVIVINEEGRPVADVRAKDDGDETDSSVGTQMFSLTLDVPDLPEGVYKVQMNAGRDVFFRSITTTQQKVTFLNNVYLGDEVGYRPEPRPVYFWTEAKNLAVVTQHAEGAQELRIGDEIVRIAEPYDRKTPHVTQEGVVKVVSPRGDLLIETDGHIAFSPDQFFNPDPIRLAYNTDLEQLNVRYIIAEYQSPRKSGGWNVASVSFEDTSVFAAEDDGTWKFTISTPGIAALQKELQVGFINMRFVREPLAWEHLWSVVKQKLF